MFCVILKHFVRLFYTAVLVLSDQIKSRQNIKRATFPSERARQIKSDQSEYRVVSDAIEALTN